MTTWTRRADGAWSIDLPIALYSGNRRIVNGPGVTGAIYRRARDKALADLRALMRAPGAPPHVASMAAYGSRSPRREVAFTRIMGRGEREWDSDNVVAGLKYVRDALQAFLKAKNGCPPIAGAGIIVDDSHVWAEFPRPEQVRSTDGRPGLRIVVRDLELIP